jgi:hypothetical protein
MSRGLGYVLDMAVGINPVADLAAGANTGKRIHLAQYQTVDILFFKNAASAGTDTVTLTLRQHTAASAGTSANLSAITDWYYKSTAAALAGTEAWTEVNQAAAATLALANTGPVPAANQAMVVFSVEADSLDAGYGWVSVDIADPGAGGTILGGVFYIMSGLKVMRRPDLLAQPNL